MALKYDLLLRGGEVIDPSQGVHDVRDVAFKGGEVAALEPDIPREEARVHPDRNVITRAIGLDPDMKVDTDQLLLQRGDLVLLCSDGLNSMIPDEDILKTLQESSTDTLCANLINAANDAGGHDNTTVVIAAVETGVEVQVPMTQPVAMDTLDIRPGRSLWGRVRRMVFRQK